MPALKKKVLIIAIFPFIFSFLFSGNAWAKQSSVEDIRYQIKGVKRFLSFNVANFSNHQLYPQFKVVIKGADGKVKHKWLFKGREITVLPYKQAEFNFNWDDKPLLSGQEQLELYQSTSSGWQLVGAASSQWTLGGKTVPLLAGLILGVVMTPWVFIRNFPNKLLSFLSRKEVRFDAQKSA